MEGSMLLPGKSGAHLVLNQAVLDFVEACLEELSLVYTDDKHDSNPAEVLDALEATSHPEGVIWEREKDNFGTKVLSRMPYKKGELRITLVLTKQNELRLDIREWYDPNAA
jgi:hypothetical protein